VCWIIDACTGIGKWKPSNDLWNSYFLFPLQSFMLTKRYRRQLVMYSINGMANNNFTLPHIYASGATSNSKWMGQHKQTPIHHMWPVCHQGSLAGCTLLCTSAVSQARRKQIGILQAAVSHVVQTVKPVDTFSTKPGHQHPASCTLSQCICLAVMWRQLIVALSGYATWSPS